MAWFKLVQCRVALRGPHSRSIPGAGAGHPSGSPARAGTPARTCANPRPPLRRSLRRPRSRVPTTSTCSAIRTISPMFVVTPAGVIATDPISYGRPQAAQDLSRRDPQDHQGADQVPDLQPPPLRPHRRRRAVQGGGCQDRRASQRAKERLAALKAAGRGPARRDRSTTSARSSSAARRSICSTPAATTPTRRW